MNKEGEHLFEGKYTTEQERDEVYARMLEICNKISFDTEDSFECIKGIEDDEYTLTISYIVK